MIKATFIDIILIAIRVIYQQFPCKTGNNHSFYHRSLKVFNFLQNLQKNIILTWQIEIHQILKAY